MLASSFSTQQLLSQSQLFSQGAEAKVYLGLLHPPLEAASSLSSHTEAPVQVFIKHRFPKKYRHATLDNNLTRSRIGGEARALARCARYGVTVPGVRFIDLTEGVLGMEWIEGHSVRALLGGEPEQDETEDVDGPSPSPSILPPNISAYGVTDVEAMTLIGQQLAKMHSGDIIHGDLTTSNMMLRRNTSLLGQPTELVLVDFGLAYTSNLVEDKAVDLYVLERALGATHPDGGVRFDSILAAYAVALGDKEWKKTETRFKDVRLRGRKRSMVG